MNEMETTINRDLLRFHVGTAIFCPSCYQVMDVRSAVSFDLEKNGQLTTKVCCASCFDKKRETVELFASARQMKLTVLDGRELFGRRKKGAR